jgi:hypothetical protein
MGKAVRYELLNGELRNREAPTTFHIPSKKEREKGIREGLYVKVGFELVDEKGETAYAPAIGIGQELSGERMWVKVTKVEAKDGAPTKYQGILNNDPAVVYDFIRDGGEVCFGPEHVLDIDE